jgi:2,3-dihydroxybenzoate-AMP ligase
VVNRAGEKVLAQEVEEHLLKYPPVRDAAVVGVDDSALGERIVAFVILRDADVMLSAVTKCLRDCGMATFKIRHKLISLTNLLRTAVGKVDKAELRSSVS